LSEVTPQKVAVYISVMETLYDEDELQSRTADERVRLEGEAREVYMHERENQARVRQSLTWERLKGGLRAYRLPFIETNEVMQGIIAVEWRGDFEEYQDQLMDMVEGVKDKDVEMTMFQQLARRLPAAVRKTVLGFGWRSVARLYLSYADWVANGGEDA
jgi:hypothetical protein